jgi:phosphoadenosine phosphosulfate reductase
MSAIDLYNRPSPQYAERVERAIALLRDVAARHPRLTQASSLGVEDVVVTHLIHLAGIESRVFVLETGRLHAETLALIPQIEQRYGRTIDIYRPVQEDVIHFVQKNGDDAMYRSVGLRKACCDLRKMEPLSRALSGVDGWITGLRREQSNARAEAAEIIQEAGRVKVSPLVDWTWGDVWHFVAEHALAYNPLHDRFFPSIGCEPCTRAISVGEDFRAGRWWWEQDNAKECGLHVQPAASALPAADQPTSRTDRTPA